jgi:hypothetical protein
LIKILKFFDADQGSGIEKIRIRDKHPESATLVKKKIHLTRTIHTSGCSLSWCRWFIATVGGGGRGGATAFQQLHIGGGEPTHRSLLSLALERWKNYNQNESCGSGSNFIATVGGGGRGGATTFQHLHIGGGEPAHRSLLPLSLERCKTMIRISDADPDPGSGAYLTPGSGMDKNPDPG